MCSNQINLSKNVGSWNLLFVCKQLASLIENKYCFYISQRFHIPSYYAYLIKRTVKKKRERKTKLDDWYASNFV